MCNVALELHDTVDQCEESVITPHAHVAAGMKFCAALANDDVPCANKSQRIFRRFQELSIFLDKLAVLLTTYFSKIIAIN